MSTIATRGPRILIARQEPAALPEALATERSSTTEETITFVGIEGSDPYYEENGAGHPPRRCDWIDLGDSGAFRVERVQR
jgi:hypothetical protein